MRDRVADVLAQREALDRGTGVGVLCSILLHAVLGALALYGAMHSSPSTPAKMVNIQLASMPAASPAPARARAAAPKPVVDAPKVEEPKIEEPKPRIEEPKPVVEKSVAAKPPEKNTVPLSSFGRSTKKGSETPAPAPVPAAPASNPIPGTTTDVAIGGSGVTGLEGGDFPHALYIQGMHRKIGSNWFRPQVSAGATVIVYFRILRDGTITEAKVQTSSGNSTFDRAALSAVRSASPLNPLPFAYSGTYLGVHLTFR
jgi:periplasmic protein TonB